jgi:ADP-ribose pyrophosphatase YjhB (NUDIX family)
MVTEYRRERPTVRVLLLDEANRILLMKGRLPSRRDGPGAWFTVGGGLEPGETPHDAAAREIREETGIGRFELGPLIAVREGVMLLDRDEPVLITESYLVARCAGAEPVRDGWQPDERELIDDIRWWTHAELAATEERVFPPGLADLMAEVVAGRFPETPIVISWR